MSIGRINHGDEEGSQKKSTKKTSSKKSGAKKSSSSRKYSPSAGKDVEREMKAMKQGKLKSGRSGKKVTSPQAGDCDWTCLRRVRKERRFLRRSLSFLLA